MRLILKVPYYFVWFVGLALLVGGCDSNAMLRKHGIEAYTAKELDQAQDRFSQAVRQDPTDWKSLYYLGKVRLAQGRPFDAQLLLERALELRSSAPETPGILDALAESLNRRGRIEDLHLLLEQAVHDYGASYDHMRQGRYLVELGDIDRAKLAYRKAAYFAPEGDPDPFVALADFYESVGDRQNAVVALRHAYTIKPKSRLLQERLREYGIVPGPAAELPIEKYR